MQAVHPHARGDDDTTLADKGERPGSPPRAWGRREQFQAGKVMARFTPTRVGTTALALGPRRHRTVHPHARGDDAIARAAARRRLGSPPRAWGRRARWLLTELRRRFTPTRVGTTGKTPQGVRLLAVHPHAR